MGRNKFRIIIKNSRAITNAGNKGGEWWTTPSTWNGPRGIEIWTVTPAVIYQIVNSNHHKMLINELTKMVETARDNEACNDTVYEYEHRDIPKMNLRLNVAKVPG